MVFIRRPTRRKVHSTCWTGVGNYIPTFKLSRSNCRSKLKLRSSTVPPCAPNYPPQPAPGHAGEVSARPHMGEGQHTARDAALHERSQTQTPKRESDDFRPKAICPFRTVTGHQTSVPFGIVPTLQPHMRGPKPAIRRIRENPNKRRCSSMSSSKSRPPTAGSRRQSTGNELP